MFRCALLMRTPHLAPLALLLALGACDGSAPGDGDLNRAAADSLIMHAAADGDGDALVPGQLVRLAAELDSDAGGVTIAWTQTGGPAVDLEDTDKMVARFRVPPVAQDARLEFEVAAADAGGRSGSYALSLAIEALHMADLTVRQREVAENFVVFSADKDIDNRTELYLATLDGEVLIKLNDPVPVPNGDVFDFAISPDLEYVAYRADQESDEVFELYTVHLASGLVAKMSGPMGDAGDVLSFDWAPNSAAVAYRANQRANDVAELFVAAADGSSTVRVSGDLVVGGDVNDYSWCPEGEALAYRADQNTNNVQELFVSDADGSGNVRVSGPLAPAGDVQFGAAWSPDGSYIAYRANQLAATRFELFVSTADGSDNRRVSLPALGPEFAVDDFAWAPDGSRIAYRGDVINDGVFELFSVRPDGSNNARVSAVPANGDVSGFSSPIFVWAPDSTAIAYTADQITDGIIELFVSGPDGTGNRRVSAPLVATGQLIGFLWSPDSSRLAYLADQNVVGDYELFVASPDGASVVQVSGPLVADGDVTFGGFAWAPNSQWLAYRADQTLADVVELYTATPDGSLNLRVSGPMDLGGDVVSPVGEEAFLWSPDSTRLVYAADQFAGDTFELFVAAPDGSAPNNRLSGELTDGGDVQRFSTGS